MQAFRRAVCEADVLEKYKFGSRSEETTLVMGLMSFVERLAAECEGMTELAQRGFAQLSDDSENELEWYVLDSFSSQAVHVLKIYSIRLECRNVNGGLTELDEKLQVLPVGHGHGSTEDGQMLPLLPEDGQAIQEMDREFAKSLLECRLTVRRPSCGKGAQSLRSAFPAENVPVREEAVIFALHRSRTAANASNT